MVPPRYSAVLRGEIEALWIGRVHRAMILRILVATAFMLLFARGTLRVETHFLCERTSRARRRRIASMSSETRCGPDEQARSSEHDGRDEAQFPAAEISVTA
jgi:hypothetical protein